MADVNIYYHKQTKSWWVDKNLDGFSLRKYIDENPIGLGTIELNTNEKLQINNLFEINSSFIPSHIKKLNGITEEIKESGLEKAMKVSKDQLEDLLN